MLVKEVYDEYREVYGARRIEGDGAERGHEVSEGTV